MSDYIKKRISSPKFVLTTLGVVVAIGVLIWFVRKIHGTRASSTFATTDDTSPTARLGSGMFTMGAAVSSSRQAAPDVGRDTYQLAHIASGLDHASGIKAVPIHAASNLPAPLPMGSNRYGGMGPLPDPAINVPTATGQFARAQDAQLQHFFNSDDVNIDPTVLAQWTEFEMPFQENTTQQRSGQVWLKGWQPLGPLDPFTPRSPPASGSEVTPGPQDPQLAYASALTAALDDQGRKFCVSADPNSVTYQHLNQLQQVPGSQYETFAASWDASKTPMVVNRRAHLPQQAARWVVDQMNQQFRREHPCFSLSGREHFERSNPPQNCGDTANQKESPITLIRVFESRLMTDVDEPNAKECTIVNDDWGYNNQGRRFQRLYLTMEIGNHVSGGAGGMFHTQVTINDRGDFVAYTTPARDEKQTFVLPRTRT